MGILVCFPDQAHATYYTATVITASAKRANDRKSTVGVCLTRWFRPASTTPGASAGHRGYPAADAPSTGRPRLFGQTDFYFGVQSAHVSHISAARGLHIRSIS